MRGRWKVGGRRKRARKERGMSEREEREGREKGGKEGTEKRKVCMCVWQGVREGDVKWVEREKGGWGKIGV